MEELIRRAQSGDGAALEELLAEIRPRLKARAEAELDRRLRGRIDASDVVQQVMLGVTEALGQLTNTTEQGLMAWLRRAIHHDIEDLVRKHIVAHVRSVVREKSIDASSADGGHLRDELAAGCSTPSKSTLRHERETLLHEALANIPSDQAEAIRMKHVQNLSLEEIAQRMNRSTRAVSALLHRGLESLRGTEKLRAYFEHKV